MPARQAFYISARVLGESVQLREQLNRFVDLPTSTLWFTPVSETASLPVTIYWKGTIAEGPILARIHKDVLRLCAQLHAEVDYEGPVNCCL